MIAFVFACPFDSVTAEQVFAECYVLGIFHGEKSFGGQRGFAACLSFEAIGFAAPKLLVQSLPSLA